MPASPADLAPHSVEWYTPPALVETIRQFLGEIDLDPCADPGRAIPARTHYTAADDGLSQPWYGRVFCNPPYGGKTIPQWVERAATAPTSQVVLLVPAYSGSGWFQRLIFPHFSICWHAGRIKFSGCKDAARFDSVICYRGWRPLAFASAFRHLGPVTHPSKVHDLIAAAREGAAHVY